MVTCGLIVIWLFCVFLLLTCASVVGLRFCGFAYFAVLRFGLIVLVCFILV